MCLEIFMTVYEKAELIIRDIKLEDDVNPIRIFKKIAQKEYEGLYKFY